MTKRTVMLFGAASALGLWAGCAEAQVSAPPPGAGNPTVVVTALKRSENIQKVPVAITAFTSKQRDVIGVQTIQDMTNFTPGLGYSTETDRITLRGIGRTTNVLSADTPVSNYDDGLYETFAVAAGRSSLDLDRVEILRGPQAALSGRDAEAGAINEITIRPSSTPQVEVRATYANYDHVTLEGAATGPIAPGWAGRIYGVWDYQNQGWTKNIVPGVGGEGNRINEWYVDGQIQGKISDRLDMWTKVQSAGWVNPSGGPGANSEGWSDFGYPTAEYSADSAFLYANTAFACNPASGATHVVNPSPDGCTNPSVNNPWEEAKSVIHTVNLPTYYSINSQWTLHSSGFDTRWIAGGTYYHYVLTGENAVAGEPIISEDLPVSPTGLCGLGFLGACAPLNVNGQYHFNYQELNGFFSNEVNFISTGSGPFQWVAGAYQFFQHYRQPVTSENGSQPQLESGIDCLTGPGNSAYPGGITPGTCPATNPSAEYFNNRPSVSDQSYAVFGQVDYKATDTLKFTGGLRYSWDRKYGTESVRLLDFGDILAPEQFGNHDFAFDLTELCTVVDCAPTKGVVSATTYNPITGLASRNYDATWQDPTATLGVEWTPDPSTLVYAKYGRGYKSGGFNIGIFTVLSFSPYTKAETVDSFEVGAKKTWTHFMTDSGSLTVDAAAYYYSYQNLQIPISIAQTSGGLTQSTTAFYNVPTSVSTGVELEATWVPVENLSILFSYSFDDAYANSGVSADPADPNAVGPGAKPLFTAAQCMAQLAGNKGNPVSGGCTVDVYSVGIAGDPNAGWNIPQSLKGQELPNAPRNKLAINALYNWDLGNGMGTAIPSVSYIWRDVQYGAFFQRPWWAAPSWDEWDARITWKSANDRIEVIFFGKNLGNTLGYDQGPVAGRLSSVTNVPSLAGIVPGVPTSVPVGVANGCNDGVALPGCTTYYYVQGVNGPAGYNQRVLREFPGGQVQTLYPTPPLTFGIEFHYKFF
jgi:iron complex outermembrane recepter protein